MALLERTSFARGWMPDADPVNGPVDALLRADNCVLDELGVVSLRRGSAKVGSSLGEDLPSMATFVVNGTRYRMAGGASHVFGNGSSLTAVAGSGDVAFGSQLGQILFARSTTKKKWDGTTLRNWGLSMTGGTPTVALATADSKVFASCDSGEVTWSDTEGTSAYVTGQDGTATGAKEVTPDSVSGRGTITKTFGSDQDFTTYSGGQTGVDSDLIEFYVKVSEPADLLDITIMIDVNSGSTNAFQDDYYYYTFTPDSPVDVALDDPALLARNDSALGFDRRRVRAYREDSPTPVTRVRTDVDTVIANAGWSKLTVRRGQMKRVGSTAGKDWSTVRGVRLVGRTSATDTTISYDAVKISGGLQRPLTGTYEHRYVYVRNDGVYLAKSAPSAASAQTEYKGEGATVTVPADASRDSQINECWLFRFGGALDTWYRVAVKTGVSGTGSFTISDTLSDEDAMTVDEQLAVNLTTPPDNIIGIEGPYYDRTFCLTSTGYLYPSKRLNPDSFDSTQVIRVTGLDETAYWVKKGPGNLLIGTSKDVYALDGDGAELPDGSMNFTLRPLGMDYPPISEAVAADGPLVVYLGATGWRTLTGGGGSISMVGSTSLLYKGQTRHGVSPVNLSSGRLRAVIGQGQLTAITPEGASTTSSTALYRYHVAQQQWRRHTYASSWRSLTREPDGTILAGDSSGQVWTLDTGTQDDASNLAVTIWTIEDNDGSVYARKDPQHARFLLDTGNVAASVAVHLDSSGSAATTLSVTQNGMGLAAAQDLSSIAAFRRVQLRITVTTAAFRFASFGIGYNPLPVPWRGRVPESNAGYAGEKVLAGFQFRVCTQGAARTFTPILDGVSQSTFALTTATDEPDTYLHQFTSPLTATDLAWSVDGDVEVYDWTPIVLYQLPLRVKVWENKPLQPSAVRRRFGGLTLQINTEGAAATVTPVLDGVDQSTLTTTTSDLLGKTLTFPALVGRDLWCRITSTTPFIPYSVEPIVLDTLPQAFQGQTSRQAFGTPNLKTISGLRLRVCTLGASRAVTPVLDGVSQTAFTVLTGTDDPDDVTLPFTAAQTAADLAISIDGDVELYDWAPLVTAAKPLGVKVWDSGPLDTGLQDLIWVRAIRIKVDAAADLTVTPYFDGRAYAPITLSVESYGSQTTILEALAPRGYKGKVPRFVITSSAAFAPYWIDLVRRTTMSAKQQTPVRIPVSLGGEVPA